MLDRLADAPRPVRAVVVVAVAAALLTGWWMVRNSQPDPVVRVVDVTGQAPAPQPVTTVPAQNVTPTDPAEQEPGTNPTDAAFPITQTQLVDAATRALVFLNGYYTYAYDQDDNAWATQMQQSVMPDGDVPLDVLPVGRQWAQARDDELTVAARSAIYKTEAVTRSDVTFTVAVETVVSRKGRDPETTRRIVQIGLSAKNGWKVLSLRPADDEQSAVLSDWVF